MSIQSSLQTLIFFMNIEWKKVIRSNAARRIQALFRGYVCRRKLIKEDSRGELTKLIKRNCSVLKKLSTVPSPGADGVEVSYFSALFQWDYVNLLILKILL